MNRLWKVHDADRPTVAGGEADLSEIVSASELAGRVIENVNAPEAALEEAYTRRIDAIEEATGVRLEHPRLRALQSGNTSLRNPIGRIGALDAIPEHLAAFDADMRKLAEKHPGQAGAFRLDDSFEDDAKELARQAETDLDRLLASRDGVGKYAAVLGGGVGAALQDPVQAPLFLLGAGPGAVRTIGRRVLNTAIKEAAIGAGSEIALQPLVQGWREEIGLEHGFGQAVQNVMFAGLVGGSLGGVGRSIADVATLARGRKLSPATKRTQEALEGDLDALRDVFVPARQDLPPHLRGAIDAIEDDRAVTETRPKGVESDDHDQLTAESLHSIQSNAPESPQKPAVTAREAIETADDADIVGNGAHGPILSRLAYEGRWDDAVDRLKQLETGEIPAALYHHDVGEIDVIWGEPGQKPGSGSGLSKILARHPEVVRDLPDIVRGLDVVKRTSNRIQLESKRHVAVVRLTYDDADKTWLLTSFEKDRRRAGSTVSRAAQKDSSSSAPASQNIGVEGSNVELEGFVVDPNGQLDLFGPVGARRRVEALAEPETRDPQTPAQRSELQPDLLSDELDPEQVLFTGIALDENGDSVTRTSTLADELKIAERENDLADLVDLCKVNT